MSFYQICYTKPIIISEANSSKIQAELDRRNGRNRARLATFEDVTSITQKLDKFFRGRMSRADLEGVAFWVNPHPVSNYRYSRGGRSSYQTSFESTQFEVVMQGGKWRLASLDRCCADVANLRFSSSCYNTQRAKDLFARMVLDKI